MSKTKYDIVIGIDPDNKASGVAVVHTDTRKIETYKATFSGVIDLIKAYRDIADESEKRLKVIIEAGWLNESNWHVLGRYMSTAKAAAIGRSVGMNHQTGILMHEMAKDLLKVDVRLQKPFRKCWKGTDGKITQQELETATGIPKLPRMNQDQRDAVLIAWVNADLPLRTRISNS